MFLCFFVLFLFWVGFFLVLFCLVSCTALFIYTKMFQELVCLVQTDAQCLLLALCSVRCNLCMKDGDL